MDLVTSRGHPPLQIASHNYWLATYGPFHSWENQKAEKCVYSLLGL